MKTFQHFAQKWNIWVDDIPSWEYEAAEILTHHSGTGAMPGLHSFVAAEFYRPLGGHLHYGALAIAYSHEPSGSLVIRVPIQSEEEQRRAERSVVNGPLAQMLEKVDLIRPGLPREYGLSIVQGIANIAHEHWNMEGTIIVCGACHGRTYSSSWAFARLGMVLAYLLCIENINAMSNDEFFSCFNTLRWKDGA